jgi:hypothetical protein
MVKEPLTKVNNVLVKYCLGMYHPTSMVEVTYFAYMPDPAVCHLVTVQQVMIIHLSE